MIIHVYLDNERRIVLEGKGLRQQRHIPGQGWCVADDEIWNDGPAMLGCAASICRKGAGDLAAVNSTEERR